MLLKKFRSIRISHFYSFLKMGIAKRLLNDEEFIAQMSASGHFVDHIEMVALSRALHANIVIIRSDGPQINGHRTDEI